MPPLPIKSEGVLMEIGAKKLGWHPWPAPMAITSQAFNGRPGCIACGFCFQMGCEVGAKSSTLVTMIPAAVATGRCEIRPNSYAKRVEVGKNGRATGVTYFDAEKKEVFQRAKAVVLSRERRRDAEAAAHVDVTALPARPRELERARREATSCSTGSRMVSATFEHEVNGWKGVVASRVAWDQVVLPKELGLYGGGGFDMRSAMTPIAAGMFATGWGKGFKQSARDLLSRSAMAAGHSTQLSVEANRVDLDPTLKDAWGLPAPRLTFKEHQNDVKVREWFTGRAHDLVEAAGGKDAVIFFTGPAKTGRIRSGLAGMGNDGRTSVVDRDHRAHDVPNLFMVDGRLTRDRRERSTDDDDGMALAFRAGKGIAKWAKGGG